ncbi:hypothetical protein HW130_19805 [Streptomyces sp. PKU-EA00015]|uniref:hypothetical protein n=1 Tax=Streptomyces sp. PKU-EA00015 TaxID=2748326 RepID=UPI0015A03B23|nr:hypothetical protein [Streptomyces sp. PKU-EA00015]NWF28484.1 hypothetical protein [Streptomyces sp. PKU-EA00015]
MSQQYPGPQRPHNQQPYQGPYVGGPAPYQPPPEPKKFMNGWALAGLIVAGLFAFLIVIGIVGAIIDTASGSSTASRKPAEVSTSPSAKADRKPAEKTASPAPVKEAPAKQASPKKEAPKTPAYPEGDYVVGEDIPAGTYETTGAKKGVFELCSISTEPTADDVMPQWKTANAGERVIIKLSKGDGIVTIQGCEPLRPRS